MKVETFEKILQGLKVMAFKSGSQVICDPPPVNSDHDYFILEDWHPAIDKSLYHILVSLLGFNATIDTIETDTYEGMGFYSLRRGDINAILITDGYLYERTLAATILAKKKNLTDKEDRIKLFAEVREQWKISDVRKVIHEFEESLEEVT